MADFRFYYKRWADYILGPGVNLPVAPHMPIAQALQKATGLPIAVTYRTRTPGGYGGNPDHTYWLKPGGAFG